MQSKEVSEVAGRHVVTWLKRQVRSFFSGLHNQVILHHALLNNRLLFRIFKFALFKVIMATRQFKQSRIKHVADVAFATGPALFEITIQNKEKLVVFTAHTLYKLILAT